MTIDEFVQALGLPDASGVNQRVPKKLLAEHGAATAADKRQIQDGVEAITWLASLKPHLIGVPAFQDDQRQYLELAVLGMALRSGAKPARLIELVHRAVPYPVLLASSVDGALRLSMAHLRTSQLEADTTVLDGELLCVAMPADGGGDTFRTALALTRQPQADLRALYQGWMDTVDALDIAHETGQFQLSASREQAVARHAALQQCRHLQAAAAMLRAQAGKEKQIARQVDLNKELRTLEGELQVLQQRLLGGTP